MCECANVWLEKYWKGQNEKLTVKASWEWKDVNDSENPKSTHQIYHSNKVLNKHWRGTASGEISFDLKSMMITQNEWNCNMKKHQIQRFTIVLCPYGIAQQRLFFSAPRSASLLHCLSHFILHHACHLLWHSIDFQMLLVNFY